MVVLKLITKQDETLRGLHFPSAPCLPLSQWREEEWEKEQEEWEEETEAEEEEERGTLGKNVWNSFPVL